MILQRANTNKILPKPARKERPKTPATVFPNTIMPKAEPNPEADAVPKTSGLASGFFSTACRPVPAIASEEPTIIDNKIRGMRMSNKICRFKSMVSILLSPIQIAYISLKSILKRPIKHEKGQQLLSLK